MQKENQTIPLQTPFKTCYCDDKNIYIVVEKVLLFRILSFARTTNARPADISIWNFVETHCKLDGPSTTTWNLISREKSHKHLVKLYFRKELLTTFMVLYAQAMQIRQNGN